MGIAEIATMLGGLSRERVHQLVRQPGFPAPVAVLKMGRIWTAASVREWMIASGRAEQS